MSSQPPLPESTAQYGKVEFHSAVLNVPAAVTPLRFLDWLREEVAAIEQACGESGLAIVKLFLPMRIRLGFRRQELDDFLQSLPDDYPKLHLMDVVQVEHSLDEEMMAAMRTREQQAVSQLNQSIKEFLGTQDAKR
jgi:hypothetical protein